VSDEPTMIYSIGTARLVELLLDPTEPGWGRLELIGHYAVQTPADGGHGSSWSLDQVELIVRDELEERTHTLKLDVLAWSAIATALDSLRADGRIG